MKKILAIVVAATLLAATLPAGAMAGDHEWATAGKILTGIVGLTILGNAMAHPAPVYAPPPRVYYPPEQVWVPGHYEMLLDREWVPGHWEAARYDRDGDGYYDRREARRIWVSGHYRHVETRLWIPGHWEERG